jgi:hypothetical protein
MRAVPFMLRPALPMCCVFVQYRAVPHAVWHPSIFSVLRVVEWNLGKNCAADPYACRLKIVTEFCEQF